MKTDIPDDLIEIHDPEIEPSEIVAQIRERIRARRQALGYPRQQFPTFGAAAYPAELETENADADLAYHLRRANDLYYALGVKPALSPSPATRIPLLGRLWASVRREAHNLVLFYLGKLAQKQVGVNRHLVSTLNRLAVQVHEQQQELRELDERVAEGHAQEGHEWL